METILYGQKIVKSFTVGSKQQNILKGIDIRIEKGEFIAIMGASGSGKSTLLYALSGMDKIDAGKIKFLSKDITSLSEDQLSDLRRKKMGFVFQQPTFLKNLNLLDNIILAAMKEKQYKKQVIIKRANYLMEQVNIEDLIKHDITQVSGGQLQRAGICRALMNDPAIIFGDEPTGALNSKAAKEVMDILSVINQQGTTLLIVTHDLNVATRAKRVLFMQDGKIVNELKFTAYQESEHQSRIQKIALQMQKLDM